MSLIRFEVHLYRLIPKTRIGSVASAKSRTGALLKVTWPDGFQGYGDLFPWPEFGDASVEDQLKALQTGRISQGIEQSIWLARRDAQARMYKRNLMRGLPRLKNHYLINSLESLNESDLSEIKQLGYQTLKVKCGRDLDLEQTWCDRLLRQHGFVLRLDFNAHATPADFHLFMERIPKALRNRIEFVEDPFPFHQELWKVASQLVTLAVDQEAARVPWDEFSDTQPVPFKVLVLKPARQDVEKVMAQVHRLRLKVAITSSLDHPVGQMHAATLCGEFKKLYPNTILDAGCFSHTAYEDNEFTAYLPTRGPFLGEMPGLGIGFDDALNSLSWTRLEHLKL